MKYKIKDMKYIKNDLAIKEFLSTASNRNSYLTDLLKGISNISKVNQDDIYSSDGHVYNLEGFNFPYNILNNQNGSYLVRSDNIEAIFDKEDVLDFYTIHKLIKSGDKTILVDNCRNRYVVTRNSLDKDDIEKAIMLLLLKREGFTYNDIMMLVDCVDYVNVQSKVNKQKVKKPTKKSIKKVEEK